MRLARPAEQGVLRYQGGAAVACGADETVGRQPSRAHRLVQAIPQPRGREPRRCSPVSHTPGPQVPSEQESPRHRRPHYTTEQAPGSMGSERLGGSGTGGRTRPDMAVADRVLSGEPACALTGDDRRERLPRGQPFASLPEWPTEPGWPAEADAPRPTLQPPPTPPGWEWRRRGPSWRRGAGEAGRAPSGRPVGARRRR